MRQLLIFFISFISLTGFSQSQADLNLNAHESYKKADKELNEIYKSVLAEYKVDTIFIKNFKASQRIWIMFRDAELRVKYPVTEPGYYGSANPMCVSIYLERLTRERIATIKEWADGIEEGDVCIGSVKIK